MVSVKEATAVKFAPLGERVVIKPIDREETTSSGIFLPDTAKEKPQEAEVVAVGSGRFSDKRMKNEARMLQDGRSRHNRNVGRSSPSDQKLTLE